MQDSHRYFLQSFMSRAIMKGKEVKDCHKRACEKYQEPYNERALVQFVTTINSNIKNFHLEIRKALEESSGRSYYVLINKAEGEIQRMLSDYSLNELELFKLLVKAIVESDTGRVSSRLALNYVDTMTKKLSKTDAEAFYNALKMSKWIDVNEDGSYSLSVRSICELEQYIIEQYECAVKCNMCAKLCLQGQNCENCDVRLHHYCASKCFANSNRRVCPAASCHAPWQHQVDEREVPSTQPTSTHPSGTPVKESRRRRD